MIEPTLVAGLHRQRFEAAVAEGVDEGPTVTVMADSEPLGRFVLSYAMTPENATNAAAFPLTMISEATEVTFSTVTLLSDPDGEDRGPAWLLWEYHRGDGSWFLSVAPFAFTEGSITWDPFPMVTDSDQVSDQQGVFALAIAEIFTVASGRSVPDGWEITRMDAERKFAVLLKYMAEQREAVWVEFGKDAL